MIRLTYGSLMITPSAVHTFYSSPLCSCIKRHWPNPPSLYDQIAVVGLWFIR